MDGLKQRYFVERRTQANMKTNNDNQTLSRMKQLEEMSREELIQEIIASSKRLEEIEAARKDEGQKDSRA